MNFVLLVVSVSAAESLRVPLSAVLNIGRLLTYKSMEVSVFLVSQ